MNNRIIKFRVWDTDGNGKMFNWDDCRDTQLLNDAFDGKHAVAMQFINLFDKNGLEIYEGDILLYKGKVSNEQIVVEYGQYNCGCCDYIYGFTCGQSHLVEKEIIGNIFETPNLLNAK